MLKIKFIWGGVMTNFMYQLFNTIKYTPVQEKIGMENTHQRDIIKTFGRLS